MTTAHKIARIPIMAIKLSPSKGFLKSIIDALIPKRINDKMKMM